MLGFPIPENEPNLHGNLISVNVPQMAMMPLTTKFIGSSSGFHDLKHKSHRFYHCDMLQTQRGNKCKIYYNFRNEKKYLSKDKAILIILFFVISLMLRANISKVISKQLKYFEKLILRIND